MPAAPIPTDEPARQAAVRALRALGLNNEPEERFDRIARICQFALGVPIALITLLEGDYQWYKSCIGIDIGGCNRDESFCAYTILSDEPLIVADTLRDPRFSDNPMVHSSPCIRFYAGIPLHSSGYRVGALCVIDTKPHTLSRRELDTMRSLATIAESELNNLSLAQAMTRVVQHESRFRSLVETSSDIIHGFDAEGRIVYANPAWHAALGYTAEDLDKGLSLFQIVHPDCIAASRERLTRVMAGGSLNRFESRFITRDGFTIDVEGNSCSHVEDGRTLVTFGVYRDISARKALDEESRRARRAAEQASLAKSQFLANISHEIRTPLNGIIGMSSMLMLAGLSEEQMRYARTIDSSGRVLLTLVNQILDFSKFDAEAVHLEDISFSLAGLIEEIANLMSVRAAEKGLNLRCFIDRGVPQFLSGDPNRLRQILTNLLGNAVKFTDSGEIRLDIRVESLPDPPESGAILRFTVMDTGIGLQPEACARIFDAFAQADSSTTRKHGGTGLGLAISRQIVRLMGGDIHVHSNPGEGATFWFTARFGRADPLAAPAPADQASDVPPSARPLRILIAEDNTINQLVLCEQLQKLGHTSIAVSNGVEALEAMENTDWDAILLDCQMPVMDGYETIAAIRRAEEADAAIAGRTWVIAVTANALDGERDACLRAGMDDFLSKPYQFKQLAEVISRIPARADQSPAVRPALDAALLSDMANAKSTTGENLLEKMTQLFTESGPQSLDQIDAGIRQDDFDPAARAAHKLAGGCSYFGAQDLYTLCIDFERLNRAGDREALRSLAPRIREEYARVEKALERKVD